MSEIPELVANLYFRQDGATVSICLAHSGKEVLAVSLEQEFHYWLSEEMERPDGTYDIEYPSEAHRLRIEAGRFQAWADTLRSIADSFSPKNS